ncbi:MAG TPA: TonB-dependent receptor [Spongiibacteraceae bacterium]
MKNKARKNSSYKNIKSSPTRFHIAPLTVFVASASLFIPMASYAQDNRSAAEIQEEVMRLKQQLEKDEQALATKSSAQPQAAASAKASEKTDADRTTQLSKVVVRSRNRIERVQDVPISVSVLSGQELRELPSADVGDLTRRTGGIERQPGNSRTFSVSVRGIGKVGQTEAQDPSVGVIVDGVNYAYNPLASFDFYDVDSVEVARGPQGTLLGKNTTMGVINVTSRRPSFKPDANYSVTLGQNNTVISQFAGGGPVIDDLLAWRGALSVDKGEGTYKNRYNPDQTFFNRDRVAGRVQFLLTPSENFNARFSADIQPKGSEFYNGMLVYEPTPIKFGNGAPNPRTNDPATILARRWFTQNGYSYDKDFINRTHDVNLDSQQPLITYTRGTSAELNWTVGGYTLTSITAYKDYHFHARNDEGTPFQVNINSGGKVDLYKQASQEFRISSEVGGFVDYQAGVYLFTNSVDYGHGPGWFSGWGADAGAWYATPAQYNLLDNANGGRDLLVNSLKGLDKSQTQSVRNDSEAIFVQANWHLSDPLTLTTGLRLTQENRKNSAESLVVDNGFGANLNPVSINGVQLGGFDSNATTGALNANTPAQLAVANAVALQYFGVADYNSLSANQKAQVAAAKGIRLAQLGTLYQATDAESFKKIQPSFVISPSYRINDNLNTYISWQHGEKAGISQVIVSTGESFLTKPEKTDSYEWGIKSSLLNKTLFLNADIYQTDIRDYQQTVQVVDAVKTAAKADGTTYFANATGNVPKVQARGLELDGVYTGFTNLTVRLAAAYNNAIYKDFPNSAQPQENNNIASTQPFQDVTGRTVAGAAKYTGNIGVDYRLPVFNNKEFHTGFNTAFTSRYNSDVALSDYGWINGNSITDLTVGLGRIDKSFDVTLVAKNVFNNTTPQLRAWTSSATTAGGLNYVPAYERWVGIKFSGQL